MPILLFKLRDVPDDEAEQVRQLLNEHGIAFYETRAGNWGASMPAIWLKDDAQAVTARRLIDGFQQQYARHARQAYLREKQRGGGSVFLQRLGSRPLQTLLPVSIILLVLYVSFRLVLELGGR